MLNSISVALFSSSPKDRLKTWLSGSLILMALFALAMFPVAAHAAPNFFTPVQNDISINLILNQLFPGAMPGSDSSGGVSDPFATMFKILNGAAIIIGGIIVAYVLIFGTVQTAHSGEMLDRQWSSVWLPIRIAFGIAMAFPLPSGYCVAQLIVMWLTVQGIGLADKVWSAFVQDGFSKIAAQASVPPPKVANTALDLLRIQTCMNALTQMTQNPKESAILDGETPKVTAKSPIGFVSQTNGYNYGTDHSSHADYCGSYSRLVAERSTTTAVGSTLMASAIAGVSSGLGGPVGTAVAAGSIYSAMNYGWETLEPEAIGKAHDQAIAQLATDMKAIADELTKEDGTGNPDPV